MNDLSWFLLSSCGLTVIVTQSNLFQPIRKLAYKLFPRSLGKILSCSMCFGFWAGVIVWAMITKFPQSQVLEAIRYGWTASLFAWAFHIVSAKLGGDNL